MVGKIDVGEHSLLVHEVLTFISSDGLLQPRPERGRTDNEVRELNAAKASAWEAVYGENEFTWADLRSEKMSEVWDLIYASEEGMRIDRLLGSLMNDLAKEIENQLNDKHAELLDDIVSDLKGCMYSRAVQGGGNLFFEQILQIYRSGGWPCGWKGAWPSGAVLAYFPS